MALWAVAFLGSTPIGGPVIGWVIRQSNARVGLLVGAVTCLVAAGVGFLARRRAVLAAAGPSAVVTLDENPGLTLDPGVGMTVDEAGAACRVAVRAQMGDGS